MNTTFPFAEDMNKLMASFKLPGFEYEALLEAQKRNVAAFQEAGTIASKSFQSIAQRQVEMVQRGFETALAGADRLAKADSPEAGAKCQIALAQEVFETNVAHLRELGEMAQKAGGQVFEVMNKRFVEGLDEIAATTAKGNGTVRPGAKPKAK